MVNSIIKIIREKTIPVQARLGASLYEEANHKLEMANLSWAAFIRAAAQMLVRNQITIEVKKK